MITVWIQGIIGTLMARGVAPAVTRVVTKAVPSLPEEHVRSAVEQLFDPNYAGLAGRRARPGGSQ